MKQCDKAIIRASCEVLGIRLAAMRGRDRSRRASVARSVAAGLLYATGRYTHREIAEALGRQHHTASVYLVGRSASHADTARAVAQYIRDREGE